jgi:hypothetical protein
MHMPTPGRSVLRLNIFHNIFYMEFTCIVWENHCFNLFEAVLSCARQKYVHSESIGKELGQWYCLQASFYAWSYYLLVISVSVFTDVCLLSVCSYPWPRPLVPKCCVQKPGFSGLAVLQMLAWLSWPPMRHWSRWSLVPMARSWGGGCLACQRYSASPCTLNRVLFMWVLLFAPLFLLCALYK